MGARGPVKGAASAKSKKPPRAKPATGAPAPKPPAGLCDIARAAWKALAPLLAAEGKLTPADANAFEVYCRAWRDYLWAESDIAANGYVQAADSGYQSPRPAVAIKRQAVETLDREGAKFGLDPLSRARLAPPAADSSAAANPLAALYARVQSARQG